MGEQAVIYTRVSTAEQADEGVSLQAQEERLLAYCAMRGLEVALVVREAGVSGAKVMAARPGGAELLQLVAEGRVQHVVALKLDRLFRNAADALNQTGAWDKRGVALHLVDIGGQAVDTSSAMGRMFLTMMAGFAELERNLIAERTTAALRHKKAHGQVYNHVPYGYARCGDDLVADDAEQATLCRIQAWAAMGWSLRQIARELTATGVPTKRGGVWAAATVRCILGNDLHVQGVAA